MKLKLINILLSAVLALPLFPLRMPIALAVKNIPTQSIPAPLWIASQGNEAEEGQKAGLKIWKPLLITAAAGGITYALYTVRSK